MAYINGEEAAYFFGKRKWIIFIIAFLLFTGAIAIYFFNFMYPYRGTVKTYDKSLGLNETLTYNQALDDLKYVMQHLKNYHPVYLEDADNLTKLLDTQYQTEIKSLSDNVTVMELWRAAERIVAKLHDGHTSIAYSSPAQTDYISDISQIKDYGKPVAINDIEINSISGTFKNQFSYETDEYAESFFYNTYIINETYLNYCGIDTSGGVTFTYQTNDGINDYHYDLVPIDKVAGYKKPEDKGWVYYSIDTVNDLGIFTLLSCNYNKEYLSVLNDFFKEVKNKGIHNIAVDLRGNGGGNSKVADEFLRYIDVDSYRTWNNDLRFGWFLYKERNGLQKNKKKGDVFSGNIYVITGVRTFSSAMHFALLMKDNGIGTIVGETSGNLPNSYSDVLRFQLPNSKLHMTMSYKKWYRIDQSKAEEALIPDYEVPQSEALDKVYELIK